MVFTTGLMAHATLATGFKMRCLDEALSSGLMVVHLKAHSKMESCMDMELIHGKMGESMRVTIVSTKSMEWALIPTLMEAGIKVNGLTVFNMEMVAFWRQTVVLKEKEFGQMES